MKIALITDTHFGARGDSTHFDNYFRKFYDEVFFKTLIEREIKYVFHLGDVFDRRKYINFNILKSCREYFFDQLERYGIICHMIAGNHDTYFKNTNDVNSPELLIGDRYSVVNVYSRPTNITVDDFSVCMVPWICADNYAEVMDVVKTSTAPVMMSHLELEGFSMYKGHMNEHGMDRKLFDKFDLVLSGHFHHRSSQDNVTYIGNPYAMTWNDYDDPRGFTILDTDTLQMEVVYNPHEIFLKYLYDDTVQDPDTIDVSMFADKMVKLIIINKNDFYKYDRFMDRLYKQNILELKIIEDFSEFEADAVDEEINLEDTISLLNGFVDGVETDADKPRIKNLLKELYVEAQHAE
jgi:DNA repair exonuclease SbcCD nuclease subunit